MSILKKVFFISLFIFFLSLLFWGIYVLSFKKNITAKNNTNLINNIPKTIPPAENIPVSNAKISPVSKEPVISPTFSPDENNIWYYSVSGELKETNLVGNTLSSLTDKKIIGLQKAIWSPDKSKVLLLVSKDNATYFLLFNIKNQELLTLPSAINSVSWLATSNKILYKYFDSNKHKSSLNISDPNSKNWKKIIDLPHDKISFSQIPPTGIFSFWNSGDAYYPTLFQTISPIGENVKTLYKDTFGTDYLWDNSGNHILVSQTNIKGGTKMQLGVINYNGGEYKNLGLPTFISKCAWSKNDETVYCALPGEIPDNSILPNDYKNEKFNTTDTFWKINIKTGEKSRLVEANDIDTAFDVSNLFLTSNESLLFFVNKVNGKLYKITL